MPSSNVAPILLNLNGDFTIPVDGQPPVAGSVSGDLRLACLDSFLSALSSPLEAGSSGEQVFAAALAQLLAKCKPGTMDRKDVVLEVVCSTDPANRTMTHSFKFTVGSTVVAKIANPRVAEDSGTLPRA